MQTKLTLRLDSRLIAHAKMEAAKRGKSLSQLVADYVMGLMRSNPGRNRKKVTPLVASLYGILRGKVHEPDKEWRRHLEEKYQ